MFVFPPNRIAPLLVSTCTYVRGNISIVDITRGAEIAKREEKSGKHEVGILTARATTVDSFCRVHFDITLLKTFPRECSHSNAPQT